MTVPVNVMPAPNEADRKRAVRRTTLWLAALAAAFYLAFIAMAVVKGS